MRRPPAHWGGAVGPKEREILTFNPVSSKQQILRTLDKYNKVAKKRQHACEKLRNALG